MSLRRKITCAWAGCTARAGQFTPCCHEPVCDACYDADDFLKPECALEDCPQNHERACPPCRAHACHECARCGATRCDAHNDGAWACCHSADSDAD